MDYINKYPVVDVHVIIFVVVSVVVVVIVGARNTQVAVSGVRIFPPY